MITDMQPSHLADLSRPQAAPLAASIIIATFERPAYICKTIRMALAQKFDNYEVVVVDQTAAYPKQVEAELRELSSKIVYVKSDKPNVAAARNLGVKHSSGEVIVFLDDDIEFNDDLLAGHVRAHSEETNAGVVVGLIVNDTWTKSGESTEPFRRQLLPISDANVHGRVPVQWAPTTNTSFKRKALVETFGFDELLFSSCEDSDLSVRVRAAGYDVLFDPTVAILHLAAAAGGCDHRNQKLLWQKECERLWGSLYFIFKNKNVVGKAAVTSTFWQNFRSFVLNGKAIRRGPVEFCKRLSKFTQISRLVFATSTLPHDTRQTISREELNAYFR